LEFADSEQGVYHTAVVHHSLLPALCAVRGR
jgi:hypothetical protein